MQEAQRNRGKLWSALLIVALSASFGILVDWRVPGLDRYSRDWLMRERGSLPVPQDIAIVAIDEKSIAAFGRFPWPRQVLAKTVDALHAASPKVIVMDLIFAEPTTPDSDQELVRAVTSAGNVVLGAQLIDSSAHGGPAAWLLPMPSLLQSSAGLGHVNVQVESEGVARQIGVQAADDAGKTLRAIPVEAVRVAERTPERSVSFTGRTLVVGDRSIPLDTPEAAVVVGDAGSRAPTILQTGRMHIDFIGPGGSFDPVTYSLVDVAAGTVPAVRFQDKYVLIGSTAASQGDRVASPFLHQTDAHADQHGVLMPGVEVLANALNTILRSRFYAETGPISALLLAALVAALTLFALEQAQGRMEFARQAGALLLVLAAIVVAGLTAFSRFMIFPPLTPALFSFAAAGAMGLLWRSLAASSRLDESIQQLTQTSEILAPPPGEALPVERALLPHGLEWKAQQVGQLNARLVERARFVDQALRSVEDGLIIATPEGIITFANRSAGAILGVEAASLAGQNLLVRLGLKDAQLLHRLVIDRTRIEREIELREGRNRRYALRLAPVSSEGAVSGIVASLSDITRQHELQQTKNDVIALVSHEMRTPLTAIQGMTELLAHYDMDGPRRKEISSAINGEVKRLASMITEYLDITRLESGATTLRRTPIKVEAVLQRVVLLLQPVAEQRGIRIALAPSPWLPVVVADAGLLGRAVENLLSNAIKYSPDGTQIVVSAAKEQDGIAIAVSDQGYGIPEGDLARIFEKFYRVPRLEDAGVPGTGLGLALVREIAELHGGTVSVASTINQSSTFTLHIPCVDASHPIATLEK